MENVFEEMLAVGTTDNNDNSTIDNGEDFDHSYDLNLDDLSLDEGEENPLEGDNNEGGDEHIVNNNITNPTNNAFAQMRTENKQFSQKIAEIDALAKSLGMQNIDDFIAKAKDAQTQLEAKKAGVPVEFAREIAEIRALKNDILAEREQNVQEARERNFISNVDAFIKANELSEAAVDKLSQDLEKDGLEINALMDMPKAALNRILSSYVGTNYQKDLERKDKIKRELPINQASKVDTVSLNKGIDELAKALAGK